MGAQASQVGGQAEGSPIAPVFGNVTRSSVRVRPNDTVRIRERQGDRTLAIVVSVWKRAVEESRVAGVLLDELVDLVARAGKVGFDLDGGVFQRTDDSGAIALDDCADC